MIGTNLAFAMLVIAAVKIVQPQRPPRQRQAAVPAYTAIASMGARYG